MKFLTYLLVFLILISSTSICYATGISGGNLNAKVRFEPNMQYGFNYILKAGIHDNDYKLHTKGALGKYVTFENTIYENIPANSKAGISGIINLPSELTPGTHNIQICIVEECPGNAAVCGRTGVCAAINFIE